MAINKYILKSILKETLYFIISAYYINLYIYTYIKQAIEQVKRSTSGSNTPLGRWPGEFNYLNQNLRKILKHPPKIGPESA